ncbi:hypothetical protein [Arcicella rigui]|uniref:Uncharacterized protein n=1 Tax=Arcicella rigui TaxID=797020 RepID=A0ABU5Q5K8_9BACT|nr:hypothetical protein [Arcicella rigui]MEA5137942.1 hypothetical protein [Arcicella rigui]
MLYFLENLKIKNEPLFYFGLLCFIFSLIFLVLSKISHTQVFNVSAWIKPFKFSFSIFLYAWTTAWFCSYLPSFNTSIFNWAVIILLGFEIVYIAIQASRGQLSHFNQSSPLYAVLYSMMAIAATLISFYTAYIGVLFFKNNFPDLPDYYVWSIRLGIILFVIFSLEGFVMGAKLTHTIGGPDGGEGIPLLHWSKQFGDPRIAHFIGMHAIQVLPVLSYYFLKDTKLTFGLAILYTFLAVFTLVQALQGKAFYPFKQNIERKL